MDEDDNIFPDVYTAEEDVGVCDFDDSAGGETFEIYDVDDAEDDKVDEDDDEEDIIMQYNSENEEKFEDFTLINSNFDSNLLNNNNNNNLQSINERNSKTIILDRDFTKNTLLEKAKPDTWLYKKILESTPVKASTILTSYLDVLSVHCIHITANNNTEGSFYLKKK